MARRGFKRRWARLIREAVERSNHLMATCAVLALLYVSWVTVPSPVVWRFEDDAGVTLLWRLSGFGWLLVLLSTFLINHFELFGLPQVFAELTGRQMPTMNFRTPMLYRFVRHPLYRGLLLSFWSVPDGLWMLAAQRRVADAEYSKPTPLVGSDGQRNTRLGEDFSHNHQAVERSRETRVDSHLHHHLDDLTWRATDMKGGVYVHPKLRHSMAEGTQRRDSGQFAFAQAQPLARIDVSERELNYVAREVGEGFRQTLYNCQARGAIYGSQHSGATFVAVGAHPAAP